MQAGGKETRKTARPKAAAVGKGPISDADESQ